MEPVTLAPIGSKGLPAARKAAGDADPQQLLAAAQAFESVFLA